jgi:hypothetical protein
MGGCTPFAYSAYVLTCTLCKDLASIEERLLDSMYQAALNLRIRGQHEHAQAKV